ncbi:MAG: CoA-binding protein, partial [Candidatus Shapirobacteria bacterium]|nr:CoA-binding protein [Candidatus Shapirobacteria bacterium]
MSRDLSGLFTPHSIAVIGASQSAEKVGSIALKNIIVSGYSGRVYPVNPNVTNIGHLKFYPNVASLPEIPDLAVMAIPANLVVAELEKCGQFGIKNVVIFSAGFKEIGESGGELEKQLIVTATRYQLNILGPNCLGFATTNPPLNVTFGQVIKSPGNLRFISQSGALAASLFDWCQSTGLGFDDFMTIGNKSIISENDILEYWLPLLKQPSTPVKPVGMYLESMASGQDFVKIISQITPYNPVFMLKPGKSPSAAKAMHSHTGAIAGEDRVLESALSQTGVIRCQELGDFFDLAQAFAWKNAPVGPQVAVISNAGGPAVLTTDTITGLGLEMAKLSPVSQQKLLDCLPRMASIINPIDVLGDALAQRFGQALEIVLQEKTAQSIVVVLTPQLMTQIEKTADIIGQLSNKYPQPIFGAFIGGNHTVEGQKILNRYKIPNYPFPE